MSRGEWAATLIIGIAGLILMGIQAWDILDRRGAMNATIVLLAWLLSLGMVAYAVYKNLKDVHREKSLKAEIVTIRDEHKTQMGALEKRHHDEMASVRADANRNAAIVTAKQDEIHEMGQRYSANLEKVKTASQGSRTMPAKVPHISGEFSNVRILSHGVITKNGGQRWMKCGFSTSVSLSSPSAVGIQDIKLRTHRNSPPCLSLSPSAQPQISELDGLGSHSFTAWPQIEYLYDGTATLPESLDMVVIDEFGVEHEIYLKTGEAMPTLPGPLSSAGVP